MNTNAKNTLLVTLTIGDLAELVRKCVREELEQHSPPDVKEVLTLDEAAKLLDLHPKVLQKKARDGEIPGSKLGSGWRFMRS